MATNFEGKRCQIAKYARLIIQEKRREISIKSLTVVRILRISEVAASEKRILEFNKVNYIHLREKGKPLERAGRKAMGLSPGRATVARLP